jgi:hypothetical protein
MIFTGIFAVITVIVIILQLFIRSWKISILAIILSLITCILYYNDGQTLWWVWIITMLVNALSALLTYLNKNSS